MLKIVFLAALMFFVGASGASYAQAAAGDRSQELAAALDKTKYKKKEKRGHVEVRGLTEDLDCFDVVLSEADVLQLRPHPKFGIAAQTTQPIERVRALVELIRRRFPQSELPRPSW